MPPRPSRSPARAARTRVLAVAVAAVVAVACSGGPQAAPAGSAAPDVLAGVTVEVAQSEACACCGEWVTYLEQYGAVVEVTHVDDLAAVKAAAGVPGELGSCHTATVAGYVVEGHVPAQAIVGLLDTTPEIDGIALPGMPAGSPGMPGDQAAPFEVASFTDGTVAHFGAY